jgi:hypothetical protein
MSSRRRNSHQIRTVPASLPRRTRSRSFIRLPSVQ